MGVVFPHMRNIAVQEAFGVELNPTKIKNSEARELIEHLNKSKKGRNKYKEVQQATNTGKQPKI